MSPLMEEALIGDTHTVPGGGGGGGGSPGRPP